MWELDHKEGWAPKNWCFQTVVLEKTLECLLDSKEIKPVNPKGNQSWIFIRRTGAEAEAPILWPLLYFWWLQYFCEESTDWKRPWCWERLKAGGEGDDRGVDGWMASPTRWIWVCENSGRYWRTGKPGVLQSVGLQRVGHDWGLNSSNLLIASFKHWRNSFNWDSLAAHVAETAISSTVPFLAPMWVALLLGTWMRIGDRTLEQGDLVGEAGI